VRVEKPTGGAERQHRSGALGDGDLATLDVAVPVEEARAMYLLSTSIIRVSSPIVWLASVPT
jgi:hypothetical protein